MRVRSLALTLSVLTLSSLLVAGDVFAADAFAADAFAADAFAADAFAGDAFAGDAFATDAFAADAKHTPKTRVSIADGFWEINGKPTHAGSECDGLLMNVRMVNATFNDRNPKTKPKGFDADKNTAKFLSKLPEYAGSGVLAITLNLQGGAPGYEGALNSAFNADGTLRDDDIQRVEKVIEACDKIGLVVILGFFYQRQDQVLSDERAVKAAVLNATLWIKERGYTNILVEIANEQAHKGYDHKIIQDPQGCESLIRLAKKTHPGLLVSASGMGNGRIANEVASASDFLLPHFNTTPTPRIAQMAVKLGKQSKAIVCNEDDKVGIDAVAAVNTAVTSLCSWGYMNAKKNQYYPFEWDGTKDDPEFYAALKKLTSK